MSYINSKAALLKTLQTVKGVQKWLPTEPTSVQASPLGYVLFESYQRTIAGQMVSMKYRMLCRVLIPWAEPEGAEALIDTLVNDIPAAVDADPTLGGVITGGVTKSPDGQGMFVTIAGALYRALDVYVEVPDKGIYQGGL